MGPIPSSIWPEVYISPNLGIWLMKVKWWNVLYLGTILVIDRALLTIQKNKQ
jgi:hypothetical protein